MPESVNRLAEYMENQRLTRGMSKREFGELLGISFQTVNNIADGFYNASEGRFPKIDTLVSISQALGIPLDFLVSLVVPEDLAPLASDDEREIAASLVGLPPEILKSIKMLIAGARVSETVVKGSERK